MLNVSFPTWLYHPTEKARIVRDPDGLEALGPDWSDRPFPAVAPPEQSSALVVDLSTKEPGEYEAEIALLTDQKNGAYSERTKLVAALSKIFPSSLERHPDEDTEWENDCRWIVFIDLPAGQASWHIHDSELPQFEHLPQNAGRKWDGHTTEQKYDRLAQLKPKKQPAAKKAE